MVKEFFRAFAFNGGITLHLKCLYGENDHHIIEALFKAVAHALKEAVKPNGGQNLIFKGDAGMIAIIDYGAGNLFSVKNALDFLQKESTITEDVQEIRKADAMILPGVMEHFRMPCCMLKEKGLDKVICEEAAKKTTAWNLFRHADVI